MQPTSEIPRDPALVALAAIRERRLAGALLGRLCGYSPGSRATFDAELDGRRVAVKMYAEDPAPEAALYAALGARSRGPCVPPLLAWDRELRLLVIGWLEGPTAHELIRAGKGERAGRLAARWLQCADSLRVELGPRVGAARVMESLLEWVGGLRAADAALGRRAAALAETLARALPQEGAPRLVHGTLYDRHILDLGEGPGIIDWQRFGRGPLEMDAAVFLATVARLALRDPALAGPAADAQRAFLAATQGLLEERALAWHGAAALLHLARRRLHRRSAAEAATLLDAAGRYAQTL